MALGRVTYCETNKNHLHFVLIVMNEYSQPRTGKITVHGNGLGAPSPDLVKQRAREIAMIDERNPDEFTEGDWQQAQLSTPPPRLVVGVWLVLGGTCGLSLVYETKFAIEHLSTTPPAPERPCSPSAL